MRTPVFAVFDTETTGFKPHHGARLLEIGVVRVTADGAEQSRWGTLVHPGDNTDHGAVDIHGITPQMTADAPRFDQIVGDVIAQLDGALPVAHNAPFDTAFLAAEFSLAGIAWPDPPIADTLPAARRLVPGLTSYKLGDLAAALGIEFTGTAHTAVDDAAVTAKVLAKLLARAPTMPWPATDTTWPAVAASGRARTRQLQPT